MLSPPHCLFLCKVTCHHPIQPMAAGAHSFRLRNTIKYLIPGPPLSTPHIIPVKNTTCPSFFFFFFLCFFSCLLVFIFYRFFLLFFFLFFFVAIFFLLFSFIYFVLFFIFFSLVPIPPEYPAHSPVYFIHYNHLDLFLFPKPERIEFFS